jgi:hypothetical protein
VLGMADEGTMSFILTTILANILVKIKLTLIFETILEAIYMY